MLGLSGAHRVGKSTLGKALGEVTNLDYLPLPPIMKELGYRQDVDYSFSERLVIQDKILNRAAEIWRDHPTPFVCDRTPLDMAAYTIADALRSNVSPEDDLLLMEYIEKCYRVVSTFFDTVLIIAPGIPFVADPDKPPRNDAYQHHIHYLIQGFCWDDRLRSNVAFMPRQITDHGQRVQFAGETLLDAYTYIAAERENQGITLH